MIPHYKLEDLLEFINSLPEDHEIYYGHALCVGIVCNCVMTQFFLSKDTADMYSTTYSGDTAVNYRGDTLATINLPTIIGDVHSGCTTIGQLKRKIAKNPVWNNIK